MSGLGFTQLLKMEQVILHSSGGMWIPLYGSTRSTVGIIQEGGKDPKRLECVHAAHKIIFLWNFQWHPIAVLTFLSVPTRTI